MRWALLLFLTLGMHGMYHPVEMKVTKVDQGMVTLESKDEMYFIEEAEAWRVGDRAECIVSKNGDIVQLKYKRR